MDEPKNQSDGAKTPEQELAELLRQSRSGGKQIGTATAPIVGQRGSFKLPNIKLVRINWLALGIGVLALVLVFGTGYFLWSSFKMAGAEVTFELNEIDVNLKIGEKDYGEIDTGFVARLKSGSHVITLSKDGFLATSRTIDLAKGDKIVLNFQLLPIPAIEEVIEGEIKFPQLGQDGTEISYFDGADNTFKSINLIDKKVVSLFRGSFPSTVWATWAPANQIALVKLTGRHQLDLMVDNRNVKGRYVVLGERPPQGTPNYNGTTTWLFDDNMRISAGWTPVLLTESIRQIDFGVGGSEILYVYETADNEYSLVRALADGQEWERVVLDMPRLSPDAKLIWGDDPQYALIWDNDKLWLADLVSKTVEEVATNRLAASAYELSPNGTKLAYITETDGVARLVIYDFLANQTQELSEVEIDGRAQFTWLDDNSVILAGQNRMFTRVDTNTQATIIIPFVGTDIEFSVRSMAYSLIGKVLMLDTDKGIFMMKI